jgi:YCII-related domain
VRVRDGKPLAIDGPFAETKEQLARYYLVEAIDLDAAIAIAENSGGALWIDRGAADHEVLVNDTRPQDRSCLSRGGGRLAPHHGARFPGGA